MPPIRFRIRTIMIVIAAVAVVMGLLMGLRPNWPLILLFFKVGGVLTVMAVFLVALVLEFAAFATYLSRGRTRPRQVRRAGNRPIGRSEPDRSGEPERV